MHYHIITIFPEIFDSFLSTSLIARAREDEKIFVDLINPREYCTDKNRQIDDEPYGGGAGMLMKAQPVIDSIKDVVNRIQNPESRNKKTKVVLLNPSEVIYDQQMAHTLVDEYADIVLICGRYEGIDERVKLRCEQEYGDDFAVVSLWPYVTLGGETPAMVMIESTARLVPGVIKEEISRQDESYRPEHNMTNIEYPQYTRPQQVEWFDVPEVLLSGHHEEIRKWREN